MNLLAHSYLGKDLEPVSTAVNIMWDFIGKSRSHDTRQVYQAGKKRHLLIDRLADQSRYYQRMKMMFSPEQRKASNVIIDIYSDYFLAKNWKHFSGEAIEDYMRKLFSFLGEHSHLMGEKGVRIFNKNRRNWFFDYLTPDGMRAVIDRVSKRSSETVGGMLTAASDELLENESAFEDGFIEFYDEMVDRILTDPYTGN